MTSTKVEVQEVNGHDVGPQVEEIASYSYTIHEDEYSTKPQNGMLIEEFSESEENVKKNCKIENVRINRGISIASISDDDTISPKGISRDVSNDDIQEEEFTMISSNNDVDYERKSPKYGVVEESATKRALYSETIIEERSIADDSSVSEAVVVKEISQEKSSSQRVYEEDSGVKQNAVVEESSYSRQTSVEQVSQVSQEKSPTIENVTLPLKQKGVTREVESVGDFTVENVSKSEQVSLEFQSETEKQNGLYNQTTEQSSDRYVTQDGNLTQEITINKKVITEEFIVEDEDDSGSQWLGGESNVSHEVSKQKSKIDGGGYEEISTIKMQSTSQEVFLQSEEVSQPQKQKAILAEQETREEIRSKQSNGEVTEVVSRKNSSSLKSQESVVEKQKVSRKEEVEEVSYSDKQNGILEENQTNGETRLSRQNSSNEGSLTKKNIVKQRSITEEESLKAEDVVLPLRERGVLDEKKDSVSQDDSSAKNTSRKQSLTREKLDQRRESVVEEQLNGDLHSRRNSSSRSSVDKTAVKKQASVESVADVDKASISEKHKEVSEERELVDDILSRRYSRENSQKSNGLSKQSSVEKARRQTSEESVADKRRLVSEEKDSIDDASSRVYSRRNSERSNSSLSKQNSILERLDSTERRKSLKQQTEDLLAEVRNATLSEKQKVVSEDSIDGGSSRAYSRQSSEKSKQNSVLDRLDSTEGRKSRSGSVIERLDSSEGRKSRSGSILDRLDSSEGRRSISKQSSRERAKINDDEEEEDEDMKRLFERIKRQRSVLDEILEKQEKSSENTNEGKSIISERQKKIIDLESITK